MILDLDIGNTRIKWRLDEQGRQGGVLLTAAGMGDLDLGAYPVERVRVSSVVGALEQPVVEWSWRQWRVVPEFARVEDGACGLVCGYSEPRRLGVDRWLAMVAAWADCGDALVVVDAGSALTVDAITAQGRHLGGYILPGASASKGALGVGTAGVRVDESCAPGLAPGTNTLEAVENGFSAASMGLVHHALALVGSTRVYLTGGDAGRLAPLMGAGLEVHREPELVLSGLALALPGGR